MHKKNLSWTFKDYLDQKFSRQVNLTLQVISEKYFLIKQGFYISWNVWELFSSQS